MLQILPSWLHQIIVQVQLSRKLQTNLIIAKFSKYDFPLDDDPTSISSGKIPKYVSSAVSTTSEDNS